MHQWDRFFGEIQPWLDITYLNIKGAKNLTAIYWKNEALREKRKQARLKKQIEMGFKVEIDDETTKTYYASLPFKGHDWMAVLAILDDCKNYNLRPNLEYDGEIYDFDEAYKLVDSK